MKQWKGMLALLAVLGLFFSMSGAPVQAAGKEVDVTCEIAVDNLNEVQRVSKGDKGVYRAHALPVGGVEITDPVRFVSGNESVLSITPDGHWEAIADGTATVWMVVDYSQKTWNALMARYPEADRLVTADLGQQFWVAVDQTPGALYRVYNPNSGEHFYTGNIIEQRDLVNLGWDEEGVAWIQPSAGEGVPVYRLYNPNAGDHHYTTSAAERDMLAGIGWNYEGVGFYAARSGIPVYRLYNPNAVAGAHHFTTSAGERDDLARRGWKYEGIAWYALSD